MSGRARYTEQEFIRQAGEGFQSGDLRAMLQQAADTEAALVKFCAWWREHSQQTMFQHEIAAKLIELGIGR